MDGVDVFLAVVIGIAMLIGLFKIINDNRFEEGRGPIGCIPSIIIIVIVIVVWILMSNL